MFYVSKITTRIVMFSSEIYPIPMDPLESIGEASSENPVGVFFSFRERGTSGWKNTLVYSRMLVKAKHSKP